MNQPDMDLFARCCSDDSRIRELAWAELDAEYRPRLKTYLAGMVGDGADDVVEETFLKIYKYRNTFDANKSKSPRPLRTWIFTIARRIAINEGRRIRAQQAALVADLGGEGLVRIAGSDPQMSPEDALGAAQSLDGVLLDWLDGLSPTLRSTFLLQQSGFRAAEVAEIEQVTVTAIYSRLSEARMSGYAYLTKHGFHILTKGQPVPIGHETKMILANGDSLVAPSIEETGF